MKTRNPQNRRKLHINKWDYVLEVGGGHNPHFRSNVVVDKYTDTNYHRSGDIKVLKNQKFMQADGENLPFTDKEFDYVISNQVAEHVDDPAKFFDEIARVGKRGYIETPSLMGEYLFPKESHKWVVLEIDGKLVFVEKSKVKMHARVDFGDMFLSYLPKQSIGYKILQRTYPDIMTVRYEWKDTIDYIINPEYPELLRYFLEPWDMEKNLKFFPRRSLVKEVYETLKAVGDIVISYAKSRGGK